MHQMVIYYQTLLKMGPIWERLSIKASKKVGRISKSKFWFQDWKNIAWNMPKFAWLCLNLHKLCKNMLWSQQRHGRAVYWFAYFMNATLHMCLHMLSGWQCISYPWRPLRNLDSIDFGGSYPWTSFFITSTTLSRDFDIVPRHLDPYVSASLSNGRSALWVG